MDNNIGFHKIRQVIRPKQEHPDIITNGSLPEFVFTFLYSIASRSILIPLRNFRVNLNIFTNRCIDKILNLFNYNLNESININSENFIQDFETSTKFDSKSNISILLNNISYLIFNTLVNIYSTLFTIFNNILLFNSDTIEQVLLQKVSYKLIDKATGKVMLTDNFSLQDVVNNALPLYTAYTDMETAKQNLISAAASLIYKNLISFFFPVSANR